MRIQSIFQQPKKQILILGTVWALAQLICLFLWGTQTELESVKYIRAAEYFLQHGNFPEKRYWFYSITTFLIAFSKWINAGNGIVFFTQLVLSLFAHITFFNALKSQTRENHPAPLITTAVLCMILPYQRWNFTLYTESVFYSLVLIFFSFCVMQKELKGKSVLIQAFLLLLVILSRPLGILLLIPWILYLFLMASRKIKIVLLFMGLSGVVIFGTVVNTILATISDWQALRPFTEGSIICAMPLKSNSINLLTETKSPLLQLFYLIQQYPEEFIGLSLKKTKAFFLMNRYYYSNSHNLALMLLSGLLYIPIILSIARKNFSASYWFSLLVILFFYTAIVLQCDDYHNRFILTLMPIFLYVGLFRFIHRFIH